MSSSMVHGNGAIPCCLPFAEGRNTRFSSSSSSMSRMPFSLSPPPRKIPPPPPLDINHPGRKQRRRGELFLWRRRASSIRHESDIHGKAATTILYRKLAKSRCSFLVHMEMGAAPADDSARFGSLHVMIFILSNGEVPIISISIKDPFVLSSFAASPCPLLSNYYEQPGYGVRIERVRGEWMV